MRETRILPRRKGYLLLCVLGCLFVFFVKTEKDLAANGNVLWTAGYVGSTLACSVILGCVLGIVGTRVVYHILLQGRIVRRRARITWMALTAARGQ